jgi:hypothetical protein
LIIFTEKNKPSKTTHELEEAVCGDPVRIKRKINSDVEAYNAIS